MQIEKQRAKNKTENTCLKAERTLLDKERFELERAKFEVDKERTKSRLKAKEDESQVLLV